MSRIVYTTQLPGNGHWSLELRRGSLMKITDIEGGANLAMLFYNPRNLLERYNAPDTLKCQHTFKLQKGNCLYSDMGRIFASIVDEHSKNSDGCWHDTICGNSNADQVAARLFPAQRFDPAAAEPLAQPCASLLRQLDQRDVPDDAL